MTLILAFAKEDRIAGILKLIITAMRRRSSYEELTTTILECDNSP